MACSIELFTKEYVWIYVWLPGGEKLFLIFIKLALKISKKHYNILKKLRNQCPEALTVLNWVPKSV